jgi:hypothetical protein
VASGVVLATPCGGCCVGQKQPSYSFSVPLQFICIIYTYILTCYFLHTISNITCGVFNCKTVQETWPSAYLYSASRSQND